MALEQGSLKSGNINVKITDTLGTPVDLATEETLQKINEFGIPTYDTTVVDSTNPNNVSFIYKKNGVTVATKTITIAGSVVTTTVTFP